MNIKTAWGVVNRGTNNITERFFTGFATGSPAIFKTRSSAREYVREWHGIEAHKTEVVKIKISEAK